MLKFRNWILRASILVNAAVLFYFAAAYYTIRNGSLYVTEDAQFAASHDGDYVHMGNEVAGNTNNMIENVKNLPQIKGNVSVSSRLGQQAPFVNPAIQGTTSNGQIHLSGLNNTFKSGDFSVIDNKDSPLASNVLAAEISNRSRSLRDVIQCQDKNLSYRIAQKGEFWVLYNYVPADRTFACHESITYTTHADFTFLDNLRPLVERWRGAVSLALYAPGTDFVPTLASIRYLRKCSSTLISEFVTFHVYFEAKHLPKMIPKPLDVLKDIEALNCGASPPWHNVSSGSLYRSHKKLLYPVNVGRNIARDSAQTHYILASDIELYPSPGIITDFLDMVQRRDPPLQHDKPKVFPLCLFEVESYAQPPSTKRELVHMLANETAIPFHKHVCPDCHTVPKGKEWVKAPIQPGLHVFHIAKRKGHWEPIFIGTNSDPYYDERLSWEGRSDKMTQGYALCVLDYEFQILDNAFLIHRPGIKRYKPDRARAIVSSKTQSIIKRYSYPELRLFYGFRKGCIV